MEATVDQPAMPHPERPMARHRVVWGDNVRAARQRKGWSQAELAARAGPYTTAKTMHQTTVAKCEMGLTKPSEEHRIAIAKALGRNPAKLFPLDLPGE